MTPPTPPSDHDSDGPYRSHLLSFLRRQALRWRDRYQVATRQVRSAGIWGVQLFLYPVYWLFRGDRQTLAAAAPPARSLAATEMEPAMMETVAIVATGLSSTLAPATKIDAIASSLASREPVAIAANGQVIELPAALQQEVRETLAKLQPRRHWLARFRGWMQAGPLVRSRDATGPSNPSQASALPVRSPEAPARSLADLWSAPTPQEPFSLQVLIQSAIAYFFGPRATPPLDATTQSDRPSELAESVESAALSSTNLAPAALPERAAWLTYEDLFPSRLLPTTTDSRNAPAEAAATSAVKTPAIAAERAQSPKAIAASGHAERQTAPTELEAALDALNAPQIADAANDPTEYLNVRVVASRYIKHPLEVVVEKLDRLLSWLEDWLLSLWQRLRQGLAGLFGGS